MDVQGLPLYMDRGRVVNVEDDVLNVVREMKAISDRLYCWWDESADEFHICEHCLDGTDRLVFSVKELDARVIHRLRAADHWYGQDVPNGILPDDEDFVSQMDADNAKVEEQLREDMRGKVHEAGDRLAWALDNCRDRSSYKGSIHVPREVK